MSLIENTQKVFSQVSQASLKAGRSKESVKVIAVTKYVDSSITNELVEAGTQHLGENRVGPFLAKKEALKDKEVTWHFIGSLQRRKVKDVINEIDYFHGLDSLKLAQEIEKRANHPIKCFLQVNVSGEETKHGFRPEELLEVLPQLSELKKLQLVGLMTMAPFEADSKEIFGFFEETAQLADRIRQQAYPNMPMTELSMGMSQDYSLAIAAGATFVRIGTAFFE